MSLSNADLSSPPEAQAEADVALWGWATWAGGDGWGSPAEVSLTGTGGGGERKKNSREMGTLRSNLQRKNLTVAHTCAAEMHRWKRPLYYDNGQTANSYGMCTVRFMEILQ